MTEVVESRSGSAIARTVTAEERDFYRENGWVLLRRLIDPALALEIKERVEARIEAAGNDVRPSSSREAKRLYRTYVDPAADDEVVAALGYSDELGSVAAHLTGRPVRRWNNEIMIKMPADQGGAGTPWHQDLPYLPHDRVGRPNIWIALVDVPPERGSLRFLSGSQRAGLVGRFIHTPDRDALAALPHLLEDYELSPELHLEPGDATVHESPTVHGTRQNDTPEPRWCYINTFVNTDVLYTGLPNRLSDGLDLQPDEGFDHPNFPLVRELPTAW